MTTITDDVVIDSAYKLFVGSWKIYYKGEYVGEMKVVICNQREDDW